jgi:hypothetical protein
VEKKHVHDFHVVVDRTMKENLKGLSFFKDCRGVSDMVVKILRALVPVIRDEHRWGEQRMSQYRPVCNDPGEIREDIHVYMSWELYRELKVLHQDLNVYSIAQLLREFIGVFFGFVDVYGDNVFHELEKLRTQWLVDENETRPSLCEFMRQLFAIIQHVPEKNRHVTIYNRDFSPLWVMRK